MSHVTNIILTCSLGEEEDEELMPAPIVQLNHWLIAHQYGALRELNGHEGGTKEWECFVFGAAFNHLSIADFCIQVAAMPWQEPENVQLFIQDAHEDRFTPFIWRGSA